MSSFWRPDGFMFTISKDYLKIRTMTKKEKKTMEYHYMAISQGIRSVILQIHSYTPSNQSGHS